MEQTKSTPTQPQSIAPPQPVVQTVIAAKPTPPQPTPGKTNNWVKIFFALLLVLMLLLFSTTIMYAYGVIPAGNKSFQQSVSNFVQAIPFMPKTPTYVLKASVNAHKKVTRFVLDASFAASSQGLTSVLGTTDFDMQIKGPVDYTDPKHPKIALNAKITREFDIDLLIKDYTFYFQLKQLPSYLAIIMNNFGLDPKEITNKWFFYDTTPLQTEARKNLDEQKDTSEGSITHKVVEDVLTAIDDPKTIKTLSMRSDKLASLPVYHLHFAPTDDVLDIFWNKYLQAQYPTYKPTTDEKISKQLTHFVMDSWIDQKTYLVHKSVITFTVKGQNTKPSVYNTTYPLGLTGQTADVPVSIVLNLSDFEKIQSFITPQNPINFTDYMSNIVSKQLASRSGQTANSFGSANNTKRRSDVVAILNAIDEYTVDHKGASPKEILYIKQPISSQGANLCSLLLPNYLVELPVDPAMGQAITSCGKNYDTGYVVQRIGQKIVVSAPKAENAQSISVSR